MTTGTKIALYSVGILGLGLGSYYLTIFYIKPMIIRSRSTASAKENRTIEFV